MVRVLIGGFGLTCPDSGSLEFIDYWCTVLSGFRGFDLIFDRPITDIAWAILRPGLDVDVITWVIDNSGLEDYFDVTIMTPGCGGRSAVILIPREVGKLTDLYRCLPVA
ncbi:hypothetical protein JCM16161A_23100 [Vulcanisaeta sp. JCM 16161]